MCKKVTLEKSLFTTHPELCKEWHQTKNFPLTYYDVSYGSKRSILWVCVENHEWYAKIVSRTSRGTGCPVCAGQKVSPETCLLATHPKLCEEWDYENNGNLTPKDVSYGSKKLISWGCINGHKWKAPVYSRTNGINCPFCAGFLPSIDYSFKVFFPELCKEWHPKNKKGPEHYTPFSSKEILWVGKCGHEWTAKISSRTRGVKGTNCPCCYGDKVCLDNCLATLFPEIAKSWHPTRNGNITPYDVLPKSNKKEWWLCEICNCEWEATIANRTAGNTGCPKCNISKNQKKIFEIIKKLFPNEIVENNYKTDELRFNKSGKMIEIDVYIPKLKFGIEYQGHFHYFKIFNSQDLQGQKRRDREKRKICKKNKITLLEVNYKWNGNEEFITNLLKKNKVL